MPKYFPLAVVFAASMTLGACAKVTATAILDTYPVIDVEAVDAFVVPFGASPPGLSVGLTADVVATVSDPDGAPVTSKWTSNAECPGTFSPSDTSPTVRFHAGDPAAICTLTLTASNTPPALPFPPSPEMSVTATIVLTQAYSASGAACSPTDGLCRLHPLVDIDHR